MAVAQTDNDRDIDRDIDVRGYVEHHPSSDYQEYLANRVDGFAKHRAACFFDAPGDVFAERTGAGAVALAKLVDLEWDRACLGFGVANVTMLFGDDAEAKRRLLEKVVHRASQWDVRLVVCRIAYRDFSSLHALETAGFRTVDAMSILLWDHDHSTPPSERPGGTRAITVRALDHNDDETRRALGPMARTAFGNGRVANDPAMSAEQVERFYGHLFDGALADRDNVVLVAHEGHRPVGFVAGSADAALRENLGLSLGYLKLVAVDHASGGRGIGRTLVRAFLHEMTQQVRFVEVGTQIDNYSALNLYNQLGLRTVSSLVTLHLWL